MGRRIAHIDMDAFYVSVELQRHPELRGKPMVVAGSGARAVVTTASYEARKFGIYSATPAAWARRRCPDVVFIQPDFEHYRARSREVMAVLKEQIDRVEIVGLDEAYMDLTDIDRPKAAARRVKAAIQERTGLGCSIGIGPNKLVAKMASDADKPDGFTVLSREEALERFGGEPPGLVPGIGPKTAEKLKQRGIETLRALAEMPDADLAEMFGGRLGPHLASLARFEDEREVTTVRIAKSESRETTFETDLRGLDALEPVLERLTGQLCETLVKADQAGRTIGIKVRLDDFSTHTRARSLTLPTNELKTVLEVAQQLLRDFNPPRPVRLLGVRVAGLDEGEALAAASADQLELAL
ncbi:MAG TPA: DNA polymerase IV [Thermoleophilaceae bacterium]|jgi:DNA polymerase-4